MVHAFFGTCQITQNGEVSINIVHTSHWKPLRSSLPAYLPLCRLNPIPSCCKLSQRLVAPQVPLEQITNTHLLNSSMNVMVQLIAEILPSDDQLSIATKSPC